MGAQIRRQTSFIQPFESRVANHFDMFIRTMQTTPARHHKRIVGRDAVDARDPFGLELFGFLDVTGQMIVRARFGKCTWNTKQDDFLLLPMIGFQVDRIATHSRGGKLRCVGDITEGPGRDGVPDFQGGWHILGGGGVL